MSENYLVERWRKPVKPLAVDDEPTEYTVTNGRETLEVKSRFKPEDIERFRTGYCCLNCWEPHETPFPEKCSVCGYAMRSEQRTEFDRVFKGTERDPRAVLIEKELDALDEKHERNFHVTKAGIIVPGRP